MKVTIETTEVEAKKMIFAIDENKELRLSMKATKTELDIEKEKYNKLVKTIQECTGEWSSGGLYYEDNKEAQAFIRDIINENS